MRSVAGTTSSGTLVHLTRPAAEVVGGAWGNLCYLSLARQGVLCFDRPAEDDPPRPLIMGQAALKAHRIVDSRCDSHGFFARSEDAGELQLAGRKSRRGGAFRSSMKPTRSQEPGLSIIIPFPSSNINLHYWSELARHLLVNFFSNLVW